VPAAALGGGLVVPFLNGIDHVARLRQHYPPEQVVAATIRIESARVAPGVIEQASPFAAVELASGIPGRARVEALAERLREVGFDVKVHDDEARVLWAKLTVLAPIALLTTWAAAPLGEARDRHPDEAKALIGEANAAARAAGVDLDPSIAAAMMSGAPATMRSSMQRDAEAGRPLELDAIAGPILRAPVDTPVTARLAQDLQARHG
jgi:2-dehydropantoate 2-reductase